MWYQWVGLLHCFLEYNVVGLIKCIATNYIMYLKQNPIEPYRVATIKNISMNMVYKRGLTLAEIVDEISFFQLIFVISK